MCPKVEELTTDELRDLIAGAVKTAVEDVIEELVALSSPEYLRSIEEARRDYREGNVTPLDEALDA